jgi:hypothetical protein
VVALEKKKNIIGYKAGKVDNDSLRVRCVAKIEEGQQDSDVYRHDTFVDEAFSFRF